MKILYVITSLRLGGAERLVTDLSIGLSKEGHNVEVFVMDSTRTPLREELEKNGIKIYNGWQGYLNMWNPLCVLKLRSVISKGNYDIIHSHNSAAQFLTICCNKKNSVLVTTEHNTKNRRRFLPFFKRIDSLMYSRYDSIITVSKTTNDALITYLPEKMLAVKTHMIYNGINISNFDYGKVTYFPGKREKTIIMVAGFRHQKDHTTLIKAMSLLSDDYKLLLVGDGVTRKETEQHVQQLGISSRVTFLGFRKDVRNLLSESDIFVLSSNFEGCPISVIEAMALGLPVIGSEVEGLSEIVADTGLLFKAGDVKELADKIMMITQNENLYREISNKCKQKSHDFDITTTLINHYELYDSLIKENVEKNILNED